jgi:hypothetical protein
MQAGAGTERNRVRSNPSVPRRTWMSVAARSRRIRPPHNAKNDSIKRDRHDEAPDATGEAGGLCKD